MDCTVVNYTLVHLSILVGVVIFGCALMCAINSCYPNISAIRMSPGPGVFG